MKGVDFEVVILNIIYDHMRSMEEPKKGYHWLIFLYINSSSYAQVRCSIHASQLRPAYFNAWPYLISTMRRRPNGFWNWKRNHASPLVSEERILVSRKDSNPWPEEFCFRRKKIQSHGPAKRTFASTSLPAVRLRPFVSLCSHFSRYDDAVACRVHPQHCVLQKEKVSLDLLGFCASALGSYAPSATGGRCIWLWPHQTRPDPCLPGQRLVNQVP